MVIPDQNAFARIFSAHNVPGNRVGHDSRVAAAAQLRRVAGVIGMPMREQYGAYVPDRGARLMQSLLDPRGPARQTREGIRFLVESSGPGVGRRHRRRRRRGHRGSWGCR